MSSKRQATQRKSPQKKGGNRQGYSSNGNGSKAPRNRGQARVNLTDNALEGVSSMKYAPTAMSRNVKSNRPKMSTSPNGDCRVRHREFLQDLNGSVLFTNTQVAINPARVQFTPWLAKIARNYESYRFNSLRVLYETEAGTSSTGTVLLSVDYDASDAAPANKQQAMNYRNSVRTAPWSPCVHTSQPSDLHKKVSNYCRAGAQPANTDIKEYDIGNLNISTVGQADTSVVGEIYIEYDVSLMTPQYDSDSIRGGSFVGGGTMTAANPFGTVPVPDGSNDGVSMSTNSLVTFTEPGDYVLAYDIDGTTLSAATVTLGAGVTSLVTTSTVFNAAATDLVTIAIVRVNPSAGAATVDYAVTAATVTGARLSIGIAPTNSLA